MFERMKSTQGLAGQRKSLPLEGKAVRFQPDWMRPKAADLGTLLHEAVQKIGGKYQEAELPDLGENEKIGSSIPVDPNVKNFSYTIVDGGVLTPRCACARMPRNSGRHESVSRKNSTALQGTAEREPFDQSGAWGKYPPTSKGRFPASGNLPVRQVCINAGIACQV